MAEETPVTEITVDMDNLPKTIGEITSALRLLRLIVVRQSAQKALEGESALNQFQKMADQTIDRPDCRDLPGAQDVKRYASLLVAPGPEGDEIRRRMNAIPMMDTKTRRVSAVAYLVIVQSEEDPNVRVGYLLSVFSAAKAKYERVTDENGNVDVSLDNAFTRVVMNLIDNHQIKNLHIGPFHRLVRDDLVAGKLRTVMKANQTNLFFESGPLPWTDDIAWQVQVLVAAQQYKGTVKGLTMGSYGLLAKGRYPKAANQLPAVGYTFLSETDSTPVPDETFRGVVADFIKWAADDALTWDEIATKLAVEHNFASGVQQSRQGEVTIADARQPGIAVKNLLATGLPLWLTGKYKYESDLPRVMVVDELPATLRGYVRANADGSNTLVVPLDFHHEKLSKPWAKEETLHKAIRRLAAQSPYMKERLRGNFVNPSVFDEIAGDVQTRVKRVTGQAAAKTAHKPLAGISEWDDETYQWALSARDRENYLLVRRPLTDAYYADGRRAGWLDRERDIKATISPAEIHKALAEAIVKAIDETGVKVSRNRSRKSDLTSEKIDEQYLEKLRTRVDDLEAEVAGWERQAKTAREKNYQDSLEDALSHLEPLRRELREAKNHLASATTAKNDAAPFNPYAMAELGNIAAALAALAQTERSAPAELNQMLRTILEDLQFTVSANKLRVHFSVRIRVSTSDGIVLLGPITGLVANNRRRAREHRRVAMFERMFKLGEDFRTAASECGYGDTIQAKKGIHNHLVDTGLVTTKGLRSAVLDCPLPYVRQILWAEYQARQNGTTFQVPEGIEPGYAAHIRSVYTSDREWALSWMVDNPGRARHAIDMCLAASDPEEGVDFETVIKSVSAGLNEGGVRYLKEELFRGKGATSDGPGNNRLVNDPVIEGVGSLHNKVKNRKVRARKCPFCNTRTLTQIVRVPEVLGGMLCTTCRRSPQTPTVVFPEDYLRLWVGPRGVGLGKNGGPGGGTKEVKP